jgi:hypothetical protein
MASLMEVWFRTGPCGGPVRPGLCGISPRRCPTGRSLAGSEQLDCHVLRAPHRDRPARRLREVRRPKRVLANSGGCGHHDAKSEAWGRLQFGGTLITAIQCASSKSPRARGLHARDGREVRFVAHPEIAPRVAGVLWAHPDGPAEEPDLTWRQYVGLANARNDTGLGLLPAYELYAPSQYRHLATTFGTDKVLIFSAGWGLVRATFLLPDYDITFSKQAEPYKVRRASDLFEDFVQLEPSDPGPLVFLGGEEYRERMKKLTRSYGQGKVSFVRAEPGTPGVPKRGVDGWTTIPFPTARKTNWHYECADALCRDPQLIKVQS